jgi:hypothetical protein
MKSDYVFQGGDFMENDVFKHIMSIGYEFETHDLAKLSLSEPTAAAADGQAMLVHSAYNIPSLSEEGMTKLDDNYYGIEEKKTGLKFNEYVLEPYKPDGRTSDDIPGKYNTMMFITSDRGLNDLQEIIYKTCAKRENKGRPKNDLYAFVSDDGAQKWPIHFTEDITRECSEFSGVEFIITHYNPKMETGRRENIIMDTFLKSCHIIFEHLLTFKERIPGKLLFNGTKPKVLGQVKPRMLFKKCDSNMFYLDTSDVEYISAAARDKFAIRQAAFMPQMTFRAKIEHIIPVIKQMLLYTDYRATQNVRDLRDEYKVVSDVESCVDKLLAKEAAKRSTRGRDFQIVRTLLFLILYKVFMYVESYKKSDAKESENYFKNHLGFASRHRNHDYYVLLKKYLGGWTKSPKKLFLEIINQPDIVQTYMLKDQPEVFSRKIPRMNSRKYGDPSYCWVSYFLFFEKNSTDYTKEWFVASRIDTKSTVFPIPDDESVLLENRLFHNCISAFSQKELKISIKYPTLAKFRSMYNNSLKRKFFEDNGVKLNPLTGRFVRVETKKHYRNSHSRRKREKKNNKTTAKTRRLKRV